METKLPEFLKKYFWDVRFEELDGMKDADFIIYRLLGRGNLEAAKWVEATYPAELVGKVLRTQRDFSLRDASFWGLIYNIPVSQIRCFNEPYRSLRKTLWPY